MTYLVIINVMISLITAIREDLKYGDPEITEVDDKIDNRNINIIKFNNHES